MITIFNKQYDEGDSFSHVNDDDLYIKSVGRADVIGGKSFFKHGNSNSDTESPKKFQKAQTEQEEPQKFRTPQPKASDDRKDASKLSTSNFKKKMINMEDTIKEEPEEASHRQISNNKSKFYAENNSRDDQSVKILESSQDKPKPEGELLAISPKTTNVHLRGKGSNQ